MTPTILVCDLHDHIEIICMRRYPVRVHLQSGVVSAGVAVNTKSTSQEEFLLLDNDSGQQQIPLLQIEHIEVLDATAPLQDIWLQQDGHCAL